MGALLLAAPTIAFGQVTYGSDGAGLVDNYIYDTPTGLTTGPLWVGVETWGIADDESALRYYISEGSTLFTQLFAAGSLTPASLGTMTSVGGATSMSMTGLAYNNGTLYGNHNTTAEGIYSIDLVTLDVTLAAGFTNSEIAVDGLDFDPATGLLWGANDGAAYVDPTGAFGRGIAVIDLMTPTDMLIAPYPAGENDLDGLAFDPTGTGTIYLIEDEPAPLHRYDIGAMAYDPLPPMAATTVPGVYSGGTFLNGPGPLVLGNYCMAALNSTGLSSRMSAIGSTAAADNNLTLITSDLPPNQFGIFITSRMQGFVTGAGGTSNGNLCLSGNLGRFNAPGQILNTGSAGRFSLAIDLTAVPEGGSFASIIAGETWNFQAWHRDGVGLGSNFSDGFEISFN